MAPLDSRAGPAKFYDLAPHHPNDVPFYLERLRTSEARVLELGCGTGRVSLPVAEQCSFLHGVDYSESMLKICLHRLAESGLGADRARFTVADISDFQLDERFDLVIAPFRVIQNLETDAQLTGLFGCIRDHLSPDGRCILNAFNPRRSSEAMLSEWVSDQEIEAWEVPTEDGRVVCYDVRRRLTADPLVLYPELVYRRFVGEEVVEEEVLPIAMRCFYPPEFLRLIEEHGFTVCETVGGYAGEEYGVGNELVVEFSFET
jgi:ubiquinone/menaquinone biosynthesis C-methylase UbiE